MNATSLLLEDSMINSPLSATTSSCNEEIQDMEHLSLQPQLEYRCFECKKTFSKLVALRSHEIVHKGICYLCSRKEAYLRILSETVCEET
jgi:hypothetical protein